MGSMSKKQPKPLLDAPTAAAPLALPKDGQRVPPGFWSRERVMLAIASVDCRHRLQQVWPSAYTAAKRMGILDDPTVLPLSGEQKAKESKYTLEWLAAELKANPHIKGTSALRKHNPTAFYAVLRKEGFAKVLKAHNVKLDRPKEPRTPRTREGVQALIAAEGWPTRLAMSKTTAGKTLLSACYEKGWADLLPPKVRFIGPDARLPPPKYDRPAFAGPINCWPFSSPPTVQSEALCT